MLKTERNPSTEEERKEKRDDENKNECCDFSTEIPNIYMCIYFSAYNSFLTVTFTFWLLKNILHFFTAVLNSFSRFLSVRSMLLAIWMTDAHSLSDYLQIFKWKSQSEIFIAIFHIFFCLNICTREREKKMLVHSNTQPIMQLPNAFDSKQKYCSTIQSTLMFDIENRLKPFITTF